MTQPLLDPKTNQLLVIECKTLRFREGENDNEIAYRIDSLGKAARGLFGETWLLSARTAHEFDWLSPEGDARRSRDACRMGMERGVTGHDLAT